MTDSKIAVLGCGSFGTAVAISLAENNLDVSLWGHNKTHLDKLKSQRVNQHYLPGIDFPKSLKICSSLSDLANSHRQFFIVVPSHAFKQTLINLKKNINHSDPVIICWGTKGFEPESGNLLSEVAKQVFNEKTKFAAVSGPSFAKELARGLPTTLTVASETPDTSNIIANWLKSSSLKAYTNNDIIGTQIGGALKNVMAIATGICDGLSLGANARAGLITRGLAELTRLGIKMGGKRETFMGLSGLGDLILTCTDNQSRNRRFGLGLGQNQLPDDIITSIGQEVEGIITTETAYQLSVKHQIDMPITDAVYNVLNKHVSPSDAVKNLIQRQLTSEI